MWSEISKNEELFFVQNSPTASDSKQSMEAHQLEIDNTSKARSVDWESLVKTDPNIPLENERQEEIRRRYQELKAHFPRPTEIEVRGLRNTVIIEAHWGTGEERQSEVHKFTTRKLGVYKRIPGFN